MGDRGTAGGSPEGVDRPVRVVLGVTGSIAAYKACEVVRRLRERGAAVTAVLTRAAASFVTPLTFEALTGRPVVTSLFPAPPESAGGPGDRSAAPMPHIELGDSADLLLVAPATANFLAKVAHGIADDALSTLVLSLRAPLLVAPAMDDAMVRAPAVLENLATIARRGGFIVPPEEGSLASGHVGPGRLADPARIVESALSLVAHSRDLAGRSVLVTAGATEEPWDPARHLSSPASGRMGYALAEEARRRGAKVVLVTGTPKAPLPGGVQVIRVRTAMEMRAVVLRELDAADVLLMAAAVSDYRPERAEGEKIRKTGEAVTLRLVPNPDILAEAGERKGRRVHVGFSVATGDLVGQAREKLAKKRLDLVVANDPNEEGAAFGTATNRVTLVPSKGEPVDLPLLPKEEVAREVLNRVGEILAERADR